MKITRRDTLAAALAGGCAVALSPRVTMAADRSGNADAGTSAAVQPPAPAQRGHAVRPLPFDPAKLKGLSEKLIRSHHENNYGGAVKNLNKVEEELSRVNKDTPAFIVGGLKERELTFSNSMVLHEHYFGNLGGDGKPSGTIHKALSDAWGSFGAWEQEFRTTGASLGGGSGWVLLDFNFQTGQLRTYWSGHHTQTSAFSQPLLAMDMYEHSYQMDYGAAAARYIDAFFRNIQWDEVNRRFELALRIHKQLAR